MTLWSSSESSDFRDKHVYYQLWPLYWLNMFVFNDYDDLISVIRLKRCLWVQDKLKGRCRSDKDRGFSFLGFVALTRTSLAKSLSMLQPHPRQHAITMQNYSHDVAHSAFKREPFLPHIQHDSLRNWYWETILLFLLKGTAKQAANVLPIKNDFSVC